jgi:type VI protein secretion system component VasF
MTTLKQRLQGLRLPFWLIVAGFAVMMAGAFSGSALVFLGTALTGAALMIFGVFRW